MFTALRTLVQSELEADLGIRFVGGVIEPPVDRKIGCVWIQGARVRDDAMGKETLVKVRVLLPTADNTTGLGDQARDITDLETLAEQVMTSLKDRQAVPTPGAWFFKWLETEIVPEENRIESTLVVFGDNEFAVGG